MKIEKAIEELRLRNEPVPTPMRLPTEGEVNDMELKVEFKFNSDYRKFLLEGSDVVYGTIEPATVVNPKDHTYLPVVIESARAYGVPSEFLPICESNGDFYCLAKSGEIHFWSHNGLSKETWPDLSSWIFEVWLK